METPTGSSAESSADTKGAVTYKSSDGIFSKELMTRITKRILNISSYYPPGAEQLRLSRLTANKRGVEAFQQGQYKEAIAIWHEALKIAYADNSTINTADYASILFNKARAYEKLGCFYLAQKGYKEVLIKKPNHTKAKESLKTDEKLLENFKLETVSNSKQQFITSEGQSNNEIKISILKQIDQIEYGTLVRQLAYKKTAEEVKNLVIILKDLGYLTTELGELSGELKYYTEAAVFYQYVITIVDERLSAESETEFTEKMITDSYQQITYLQQLIYSAVEGVPTHAPIVQVESNGNNQLLSSLRSKAELELFQKKVDADNRAKVQMPLEEQARNILFRLRKEVAEEIVTIECNRIQSVKAGNTGAGEQQRVAQQEQETHYVEKTRKLFEKIATDMGNFLKKLYEESEAELGERPCDYAVIGLGSMALKQMTPYSDLEFAILTENEDYTQSEDPKLKGYFTNLSHLVNFKMINLGESIIPTSKYGLDMSHLVHVAVNFDLGGKTPLGRIEGDKPYELIRTVDGMLHYVRNEGDRISHIDKNLPYILETVSFVHGDEKLVETYKGKVTEFLHEKNKDDLSHGLNCEIRSIKILKEGAREIDYLQPTLGLELKKNACTGDVDNLQPDLFAIKGRLFNVKQEIYRLPDRMVYNFGLYFGIEGESSWDTVDKLASRGIISPQAAINLKNAITFSTTLRLKTYAHHKAQRDDMAIFLRPAETESELKEQTRQIFHLPEEDLREKGGLFQYFYTALPLHERLEDFCYQYQTLNDESRKTFFKNTKFYVDDCISKGLIHHRLAQYKEAQSNLEEALDNPQNQDKLGVRNTLGVIYHSFGNSNQAIEQFKYCLNIYLSRDKSHPAIPGLSNNLATAYVSEGQYDQAIDYYKTSLTMNEIVYQDQPSLIVAASFNNLGKAYCHEEQYDQAIDCYEKSLKMTELIYKKEPKSEVASVLNNLGTAYEKKGQYDQAIENFKESLEIDNLVNKNEPTSDVAVSLNNLGSAYSKKEQYDLAIEYFERSLKMYDLIYKKEPTPDVAGSLINLGNAYSKNGQYDQAIEYHERSLKMYKLIYKEEFHLHVAASLNNLGSAYEEKGQYDLAIKYYKDCLKMEELIYKNEPHPDIASSLNNLGNAYSEKEQYDQAYEYFERSFRMKILINKKEPLPDVAGSLNNLGLAHQEKGQYDQAKKRTSQNLKLTSSFKDHPNQNGMEDVSENMVVTLLKMSFKFARNKQHEQAINELLD